jgi:geranylgeranyl diphosphate synthase, type II
MLSFYQCSEVIENELRNLRLNTEPRELYDPIRYILSIGGKRIRPGLLLMGNNLFSDSVDAAINPAIAIEIFHNFTLLHDDIMDNAIVRRNKPTVHEKWNKNIALLSGDSMLIKAYEYMSKSDPSIVGSVLNVFNKTAIEVCEGQQYDMNFEERQEVSIEEYLRMIELKTSVLIGASLKIGAITGKASNTDADNLYDFGKNLGLAFQLQDDLLDVYANPDTFGKNNGGDIVSNKKTYLLINALNLASVEIKKELNEWLQKKDFNKEEKIKAVTNIFDMLGIEKLTREKTYEYFQKAFISLDKIEVEEKRKHLLKEVAEKLMGRNK